MGILVHPFVHVVDAYQREDLLNLGEGVLFLHFFMDKQRLGQLLADGIDGVQAGHGVLEDHADLCSAELPFFFLAHGQNVLTFEGDGAFHHPPGRLEQAHNGIGLHALAGARLAHDAHDLSVVQLIGNAVDRLHLAHRGEEGDMEAVYLQQWLFFFHDDASLL